MNARRDYPNNEQNQPSTSSAMQSQAFTQGLPVQTDANVAHGTGYPNNHPVISVSQNGQVQSTTKSTFEPIIYKSLNGRTCIILGGLQIAVCLLAMALDITGFVTQRQLLDINVHNTRAFNLFSACWCCGFCILSGGFAIGAGRKKTKCLTITTLTMAPISLLFSLVFLGIACWAVADTSQDECAGHGYNPEACIDGMLVCRVMAPMMVVCAVAEITLSIWLMVICSAVVCPGNKGCYCYCPCCSATACCGNKGGSCCCPYGSTEEPTYVFVNQVSATEIDRVGHKGQTPVIQAQLLQNGAETQPSAYRGSHM